MRKIIGVTLSFTALIASACGGGGAQPAATAAPTQAAASAAATTAATTAPTTAPTAAATADQDKALIDLLRARSAQYKVTYDFTLTPSPGGGTQQLTQYFKAPNFRQDITANGQTFITIINAQGTFSCGAFGPQGNGCINFGALAGGLRPSGAPTTGGTGAGSGPQGAPTDLTGFNLAFTSTKTVAGQTARCYSFSGAQTSGVEITACYSSQAIPLYMSTKSAQFSSEMTATSFSTNVTDADFALPYPVTQIPGFPIPTRP